MHIENLVKYHEISEDIPVIKLTESQLLLKCYLIIFLLAF